VLPLSALGFRSFTLLYVPGKIAAASGFVNLFPCHLSDR
jgi:hypothetical protein